MRSPPTDWFEAAKYKYKPPAEAEVADADAGWKKAQANTLMMGRILQAQNALPKLTEEIPNGN